MSLRLVGLPGVTVTLTLPPMLSFAADTVLGVDGFRLGIGYDFLICQRL